VLYSRPLKEQFQMDLAFAEETVTASESKTVHQELPGTPSRILKPRGNPGLRIETWASNFSYIRNR